MKLVLQTLLEELNRLKSEGVNTVPVSDGSLAALQKIVDARTIQAINQAETRPVRAATPSPTPASVPAPAATPTPASTQPAPRFADTVPPPASSRSTDSGPTGLEAFLSGKETSRPEPAPSHSVARKLPPPPELTLPSGTKAERLSWLEQEILKDPLWKLHARPESRPLLDHGHVDTGILFLGDSPSEEEQSAGEAFVNAPGQLYLKIMQAMGLKRDDVTLGHAFPWRPLGPVDPSTGKATHRDLNAEEIHYCQGFLGALIDILQPRLIIALGASTGKGLFGTTAFKALTEVRGQWKEYHGIPTLISFHPNYLLLKGSESKTSEKKTKRAAWEDMLKVMERLGLPISEKQRAFFL
jgi:DNA polymerase